MENVKPKCALSLITGEIFKITEKDMNLLFKYQVPLIKPPSINCKKCYGRGIQGKNRQGVNMACTCLHKIYFDVTKHQI